MLIYLLNEFLFALFNVFLKNIDMTFVKFFYIIGLFFWGGIFIKSFFFLFALNDLGEFFEIATAKDSNIVIKNDSLYVNIEYDYMVNNNVYNDSYKMIFDYYKQHNIDSIIIKYNVFFPSISYIEGIPLKIRQQKIDVFISVFFIILLILIWSLGDKEKWIKRYRKIGM